MVSDIMDNISHRAVIRYLGLKGLTPKEIHDGGITKEECSFIQHVEEVGC